MALAPSPQNYTLGRGIVYIDRKLADGSSTGERDVGNAPAFNVALEQEKLEHFSSRSGFRSKDKEATLQLTATVTFTLDEVNVENLALVLLANTETVNQSAGDFVTTATARLNRYEYLGRRAIGIRKILHGTVTGGPFQEDETITGGTSAATAVVERVDSGALVVSTVGGTPPFQDGETLTGGTSLATAPAVVPATGHDADGLLVDRTDLVVKETSTLLVKDTDYQVDATTGRIFFMSTLTATVGATIDIEGYQEAVDYVKIKSFTDTEFEAFIRFVGDPATGTPAELKLWRVSLQPDGEIAWIGEDWATLGFTGEILEDALCHPDNPFMEVLVDEDALAVASAAVCDE